MILNKIELKKIILDFNSISSRVLTADYQEYNYILSKFKDFIDSNELIHNYISKCGQDDDIGDVLKEISNHRGNRLILGKTEKEEINSVYSIISHIIKNNTFVAGTIALSYSSSSRYQDKLDGFNDSVIKVLIDYIRDYLTKIGFDMGIDENKQYVINYNINGQVILGNNYNINKVEIENYINVLRKYDKEVSNDIKDDYHKTVETIENEIQKTTPDKNILKQCLDFLLSIKGPLDLVLTIKGIYDILKILL